MTGYTVVAANLDPKGSDLIAGCSKANYTAHLSIRNQGAALCNGFGSNCAGFTTFMYGGVQWTCPKSNINQKPVAYPRSNTFCLYKKN